MRFRRSGAPPHAATRFNSKHHPNSKIYYYYCVSQTVTAGQTANTLQFLLYGECDTERPWTHPLTLKKEITKPVVLVLRHTRLRTPR
jgi:hypothetical protein